MKITDVKATTLRGFKQWNYVLIETDEGMTGLGEAHPGSGIVDIAKGFKKTLIGEMNPVRPVHEYQESGWLGADLCSIEELQSSSIDFRRRMLFNCFSQSLIYR